MEEAMIVAVALSMFAAGFIMRGLSRVSKRRERQIAGTLIGKLLDEIQVRDLADDFFPQAEDKRSRVAAVRYAIDTAGSELYDMFDAREKTRIRSTCRRILDEQTRRIIEDRRATELAAQIIEDQASAPKAVAHATF